MAVVKEGTTAGQNVGFGVTSAAEASANSAGAIQSYSCTTKRDVKELRDRAGHVICAAFHKQVDEITLDYVGAPVSAHDVAARDTASIGAAAHGSAANEIYIDEVTVSVSAEGYRQTSIKLTGYYDYD